MASTIYRHNVYVSDFFERCKGASYNHKQELEEQFRREVIDVLTTAQRNTPMYHLIYKTSEELWLWIQEALQSGNPTQLQTDMLDELQRIHFIKRLKGTK